MSITDPVAIAQIYGGKNGFPKGPIYEDKLFSFLFGLWGERESADIKYHSIKSNQYSSIPEIKRSITENGS